MFQQPLPLLPLTRTHPPFIRDPRVMNLVLLNKLSQSYFLNPNDFSIYVAITVLIFIFLLRYSSILRIFPASLVYFPHPYLPPSFWKSAFFFSCVYLLRLLFTFSQYLKFCNYTSIKNNRWLFPIISYKSSVIRAKDESQKWCFK